MLSNFPLTVKGLFIPLISDGNWPFVIVGAILLIFLGVLIFTIVSVGKLAYEHEERIAAAKQFNRIHRIVDNKTIDMETDDDIDEYDDEPFQEDFDDYYKTRPTNRFGHIEMVDCGLSINEYDIHDDNIGTHL